MWKHSTVWHCWRLCETVFTGPRSWKHSPAWDYLKLFETVWDCLRLFEAVWDCLRLFGTAWDCLKLLGTVWDCFCSRLSETVWGCLRKSEIVNTFACSRLFETVCYSSKSFEAGRVENGRPDAQFDKLRARIYHFLQTFSRPLMKVSCGWSVWCSMPYALSRLWT